MVSLSLKKQIFRGQRVSNVSNHIELSRSATITNHHAWCEAVCGNYSPAIYCLPNSIGLGSIKSSLELIDAFSNAQNGINQYLEYDVEAFKNVIVNLERNIMQY